MKPRLFQAVPLALLAAVPFAVAFQPAQEKLDLRPRFKKDQSITITQTIAADMALDELSVEVDGAPVFGDGVAMDFVFEGEVEMSETILEVRDGDIAKMRVTFDTMDMGFTGEVDAMGEGETIDETIDIPMVGHTIEMTVDEAGDVKAKDITEDVEPLADDMLAGLSQKNHFELILPTEPVEVGVEFELAPDWQDLVRDGMSNMDAAELDAEQIAMVKAVMDAVLDASTFEAVGKVTQVEEGIATIEYEMAMAMTLDDLVGLVKSIAPPDQVGEIPPGIEAMLEATAEMSGTGLFDLRLGQMTSLEIAGDFEVGMDGSADMQGTSAAANMAMSGSFEMKAALSVE